MAWERRDARITNYRDGSVAFEQLDVEFPVDWSLNATNIVAQKYFRGTLGTPEREHSLKQVADRVVDTITQWGVEDGYFVDDGRGRDVQRRAQAPDRHPEGGVQLAGLVQHRRAGRAPAGAAPASSSRVDDKMDSILNWYVEEGTIFKGGSGAGRQPVPHPLSVEHLKGGGTASGPVSFMRGADASAGTIKSGGKTRRAAKMVILDVDHPDIEEFIWCKAREEQQGPGAARRRLRHGPRRPRQASIQYQNANNSVRVTDEFMQAVVDDADWHLTPVTTGEVVETVQARDLMRQIAQAAWECADPGMQFDTTINRWHTAATTGRINGSNPCSRVHAPRQLGVQPGQPQPAELPATTDDDGFDVEGFKAAVEVVFTAQEILVGNADYPTEPIGETSRRFRQLGLGYANLGALLMALGLPYDSDDGRAWAAAITALMTGHAYATSARTAARMGPFAGYAENAEHMLRVLDMHRAGRRRHRRGARARRAAVGRPGGVGRRLRAGRAPRRAQHPGLGAGPHRHHRPMMDCDTTGIEPDLGLVKMKKLVGGGTMSIVNQTVPRALRRLGYDDAQIDEIVAYIDEHKSILGAPHLAAEHVAVFACSMGDNADPLPRPRADDGGGPAVHLRRHLQDGQHARGGHRRGRRAAPHRRLAARPQGRRHLPRQLQGRPAPRDGQEGARPPRPRRRGRAAAEVVERIVEKVITSRSRSARSCPATAASRTFEFRVADCKGFVTVGEYEDGRPGEIFMRVSKQGSTLAGIMDAFAISVSYGLQYGVPLRAFVETFTNMRFEPAGMTDDPDIRFATSILDYIFRRLAVDYLSHEERAELSILTVDERTQPTLPGVEESVVETRQGTDIAGRPAVDRVGQHPARRARRVGARRRPRRRRPAAGPPRRRPDVHAVRRPDAAGRLLPRLPQLRHHQRLQLTQPTNRMCGDQGALVRLITASIPGSGASPDQDTAA